MSQSRNVFQQLTPDQIRLVIALSHRIAGLVRLHLRYNRHEKTVNVDLMLIRMDVSLVTAIRGLDLLAMLDADDLLLWSEWGKMQKNINRVDTSFSFDVPLHFASIGANSRIILLN